MIKRLSCAFFEQPTVAVAEALIGAGFHFQGVNSIITETEAYVGHDDPACHAARGQTPRNRVMFEKAGLLYVYFIYGMYHCMNVVTEKEGFPAAVLIRGIYLPELKLHLDGPGKLCRYLNITKMHNGLDTNQADTSYFFKTNIQLPYQATARIGIKVGLDKPWRFVADKKALKLPIPLIAC